MTDHDLAVVVNYRVDYPGTRPQVSVCSAAAWNEHNPHIPVSDSYGMARHLGPVFNNRATSGERVPDASAARRALRRQERRLGLFSGALEMPVSEPAF